jgi:phosphohistidine phosphatase
MKTLLILRHGQAMSHSPSGDKGRTLTRKGAQEAAEVGRQIQEQFGCPDLILASDATRAHRTAQIVAEVLAYPHDIDLRGAIYEANVGDLWEIIQSLPDTAYCALLVGHNPSLEQLAGIPVSLPTAGLIPFQFDIAHWQDVPEHF